jgi:hypothetical protein
MKSGCSRAMQAGPATWRRTQAAPGAARRLGRSMLCRRSYPMSPLAICVTRQSCDVAAESVGRARVIPATAPSPPSLPCREGVSWIRISVREVTLTQAFCLQGRSRSLDQRRWPGQGCVRRQETDVFFPSIRSDARVVSFCTRAPATSPGGPCSEHAAPPRTESVLHPVFEARRSSSTSDLLPSRR